MAYQNRQRSFLLVFLIQLLCTLTSADLEPAKAAELNRYVTRPGLQAPKWNVSIHDRDQLAPGYWFVSPYEHINQKSPGKGWIGPHIYDNDGELVWSGAETFGHMSAMDFRISNVNGKDVISMIRPEIRHAVLMDNSFRIIEDVTIEGLNMHDLNFVDEGKHALVITKASVNASEEVSRVTGLEHGKCSVAFQGIMELDTTTWEPVWNWTAYEHIALDETSFKYGPATDRCKHEWDFMHANAIDKCPDGDIILSTRHSDTIYKISRQDGSIVWRLGGKKSDFEMPGLNFSRQHDVRCHAQNETHTTISFLDNSKGEDPKRPTSAYSRGLLVSLNTEDMTAEIVTHYDHPDRGYTHRRGSYQAMPNGHVFMGWSEQALHSEHTADGTLLMEARLQPEWLGSYRSYKFPFVGRPLDPPDVLSHAFTFTDDSTGTNVYVSWNGATEVSSWNVYRTDATGHAKATSLIASKARSGFETSISYDGYAKYVIVEALDKHGNVLENGRSQIFNTLPSQNMLTSDVATEELWLQQIAEGVVAHRGRSRFVGASTGIAFVGGFILCALFVAVGWAIRRTGLKGKIPWYRSEQQYLPLVEKDEIRINVRDCDSESSGSRSRT